MKEYAQYDYTYDMLVQNYVKYSKNFFKGLVTFFFDIAPAFAVPRVVNAGKDIHAIEWCLSQAVSLSHSWTVTNCQPPYRREHLQSPASRLSFESTSRPHHG